MTFEKWQTSSWIQHQVYYIKSMPNSISKLLLLDSWIKIVNINRNINYNVLSFHMTGILVLVSYCNTFSTFFLLGLTVHGFLWFLSSVFPCLCLSLLPPQNFAPFKPLSWYLIWFHSLWIIFSLWFEVTFHISPSIFLSTSHS